MNKTIYIARVVFLSIPLYLLFLSGGKDILSQNIAMLFTSIIFGVSAFYVPTRVVFYRTYLPVLIIFLIVSIWIFIQSMQFSNNPFENEIWIAARNNLMTNNSSIMGAISIDPIGTRDGIVALSPIIAFLCTLSLWQNSSDAINLLRKMVYLGAFVAFFGILQHFFFPWQNGLFPAEYYSGGLISFFINRNSAGDFFGIGIILSAGFCVYYLNFLNLTKLISRFSSHSSVAGSLLKFKDVEKKFLLFFSLFFVQLIALALTNSRGAYAATLFGLFLFVYFAKETLKGMQFRINKGKKTIYIGKYRKIILWIAPFVMLLFVFLLIGSQTVQRVQEEGGFDSSRMCTYISTINAIMDHFWQGTGFGTFSEVFPKYRDAECNGINGVWKEAHNSFLEGMLALGFVFIPCTISLYYVVCAAFYKGWRKLERYRFAPAVGLSIIVLITLHSLVDFPMQIPAVAFYASIILGSITTISLDNSPINKR